MMRKILYSPGHGAGWTTWEGNEEMKKFMLDYPPFVAALERGEKLTWESPVVQEFLEECQKRFNRMPYLGGLRDLTFCEVDGRVRITEYDGSESVEEEGEYAGWL